MAAGGPLPGFSFDARQVVMDWPYYDCIEGRTYDVSLDGQRFVTVKVASDAEGAGLAMVDVHVVLNWFEELRERMGSD